MAIDRAPDADPDGPDRRGTTDRTATVWPSDHARVVADLHVRATAVHPLAILKALLLTDVGHDR